MDVSGSAFPSIERISKRENIHGEDYYTVESEQGMSLRDWFAGQALERAADVTCDYLDSGDEAKAREHALQHARAAYIVADAMLRARGEF